MICLLCSFVFYLSVSQVQDWWWFFETHRFRREKAWGPIRFPDTTYMHVQIATCRSILIWVSQPLISCNCKHCHVETHQKWRSCCIPNVKHIMCVNLVIRSKSQGSMCHHQFLAENSMFPRVFLRFPCFWVKTSFFLSFPSFSSVFLRFSYSLPKSAQHPHPTAGAWLCKIWSRRGLAGRRASFGPRIMRKP